MEETPKNKDSRATVKVCLSGKCSAKGAELVYQNLKDGLSKEEALVLPVKTCLGFCQMGPIVAINDNIVKNVKPFLAIETIRRELGDPSCRADGLGSRSIDELDTVLDDIVPLDGKSGA